MMTFDRWSRVKTDNTQTEHLVWAHENTPLHMNTLHIPNISDVFKLELQVMVFCDYILTSKLLSQLNIRL